MEIIAHYNKRLQKDFYRVHLERDSEIYELEGQSFGLCVFCGNDQYNCEPDALGYVCEDCGKQAVYGIIHLAMNGRIIFPGDSQDV